jgi:putative mcrBC restriction endonuclease system, mcrB subunit
LRRIHAYIEFCTEAAKKKVKTTGFNIADDATIWKVTIRSEVRQDCFDNNRVCIDWDFDKDGASRFVNDMVAGDIIISTDGNRKRINGIAVITDEKAYELKTEADKTTRDVKWLAKGIDADITDINADKILHRMTVARIPKMKISDIVELAGKVNNNLG